MLLPGDRPARVGNWPEPAIAAQPEPGGVSSADRREVDVVGFALGELTDERRVRDVDFKMG